MGGLEETDGCDDADSVVGRGNAALHTGMIALSAPEEPGFSFLVVERAERAAPAAWHPVATDLVDVGPPTVGIRGRVRLGTRLR